MAKIFKCEFEVKNHREDVQLPKESIVIKIFVSYQKGEIPKWIKINLNEIIQILDCKTSVTLSSDNTVFKPETLCLPGRDSDFAWCISVALRLGYHYGVFTDEEYMQYIKKHFYEYYVKQFHSTRKMCQTFFHRYFSKESRKKYIYIDDLFFEYRDAIEEKGNRIDIKKGGQFYGCYEDDYGRKRPLTSPKYYESIVPDSEKLWVCFVEETMQLTTSYKVIQAY